jgi:hypothetical protein
MKLVSLFLTNFIRSRSQFALLIAGLIYIPFEIYYLIARFGAHSQDLHLYYDVALKLTQHGIPYMDFPFEYPPLAMIPILAPQVVNHFVGGSFNTYCFLFALQNLSFAAISARLIYLTGVPNQADRPSLTAYFVIILLSLPIYLFRYDSFPALLSCIAVYSVRKQSFGTGIAIVTGALAKIYPLVMAPVILLWYTVRKDYRKAIVYCGGIALMSVLTLAITLKFAGDHFMHFLEYHLYRGIHLESLAGGILLMLKTLQIVTVYSESGFGSINLISSLSPVVLSSINIVAPVILILLHIFYATTFIAEKKKNGTIGENTVIAATGSLVLAFIILNKVFSPQYIVWLFPFIPFYNSAIRGKFIVALILTITIFPGWYPYLIYHHPVAIIALNVRNALLIWIMIDILRSMVQNAQNLRTDISGPI